MSAVKIPTKAFCVNLKDREGKWLKSAELWEPLVNIERVEAIDTRPNGSLGCYLSHLKVLEDYMMVNSTSDTPLLVIEDDAIPCDDFNERLKLFLPQLPLDWNIFMLGHWPMPKHSMRKISENIWRAEFGVLATHCYLVNPNFIPKMIEVFKASSQKNLDRIFNILQDRYKTYIAIPSFSYQEGGWSDTGNSSTNYSGTKTYFKNTLNQIL